MRKVLAVLCMSAVLLSLVGCAAMSTDSDLKAALLNSQKQLETSGVFVNDTLPGGRSVSEVHDPKSALFVNNAVFDSSKNLKQISRSSVGVVSSLSSGFAMGKAKAGTIFTFASSTFKVLSAQSVIDGNDYTVILKVADVYGALGVRKTSVKFEISDHLVRSISIQGNLYDPNSPEEVCYYNPTGCALTSVLDYTQQTVNENMKLALNQYEHAQLHDSATIANFRQIMQKLSESYSHYHSWTTTNSKQTSGVIYNSSAGVGVSWDEFEDKPTVFNAASIGQGKYTPDRGFINGIFFDTTDGGSTFFYQKVVRTSSGEKDVYEVLDQDGNVAGTFVFTSGLLTSFLDNSIGLSELFEISSSVDTKMLSKYIN